MKIKQLLVRFGLPLVGILFAVTAWRVIAEGKPQPDTSPPAITPAQAPRDSAVVAGAGVVEPSSELIAIANPVQGIVTSVRVTPGQKIRKGEPLYALDDTELRAEMAIRKASLVSASRRVSVAEIEVQELETSFNLYNRITDKRAVIQEEMNRRDFAAQLARARLVEARAAVIQAQEAINETQTRQSLRTVRSPIDGTVLQVKARLGQFAPANQLNDPLVTMGQLEPLHVRVDVDEADISRLKTIGSATISPRGSPKEERTATLVRVEPLVVPKRSLTNAVAERVDTRVMQIVFALPKDATGFAVGQQVDAFIPVGGAQ
jgi:multidrug resistance efflux pump